MKKSKVERKQQRRLTSFEATINDNSINGVRRYFAPKVDMRAASGGYHRPGSNKKG